MTHVINNEFYNWNWKHSFIKNNILYSNIEICTDYPDNISLKDATNLVFISEAVMQMLNISLGDPVVLCFKHTLVIKLAWPNNTENVFSIKLALSASKLDDLNNSVVLQKLIKPVLVADEISIKYIGKDKLPSEKETILFLSMFSEKKIVTPTNKIYFRYYGRQYIFQITGIKSHKIVKDHTNYELCAQFKKLNLINNYSSTNVFYKITNTTDWKIHQEHLQKPKFKHKLEDIGGYEDVIEKIRSAINKRINRGILLYGSPGVGKTMIIEAILNEQNEHIIIINFSMIYCKTISEINDIFRDKLEEAKTSKPSIIYIEHLDILFYKEKNNNQEKKILSMLINIFNDIDGLPIVILATTSNLELMNKLLKRPGKFDKLFEISVPNVDISIKIINKMLTQIDHNLTDVNVSEIAVKTHGYVGEDFKILFKEALLKMNNCIKNSSIINENTIKINHFTEALKMIKPSSIKQI